MKAIFFDIFGTLVDWRSSIMEGAKNLIFFNKRRLELEKFVINWRIEYQPILNQVNDNTLPWKNLDELHEYTLENVLKKMGFYKIGKKDKTTCREKEAGRGRKEKKAGRRNEKKGKNYHS